MEVGYHVLAANLTAAVRNAGYEARVIEQGPKRIRDGRREAPPPADPRCAAGRLQLLVGGLLERSNAAARVWPRLMALVTAPSIRRGHARLALGWLEVPSRSAASRVARLGEYGHAGLTRLERCLCLFSHCVAPASGQRDVLRRRCAHRHTHLGRQTPGGGRARPRRRGYRSACGPPATLSPSAGPGGEAGWLGAGDTGGRPGGSDSRWRHRSRTPRRTGTH